MPKVKYISKCDEILSTFIIQNHHLFPKGVLSGQMWQPGHGISQWQGDDWPHELWPWWIRAHSKPGAFTGRVGPVWGWGGHAAQHHRWTEQKDGLTEGTKVTWPKLKHNLLFGGKLLFYNMRLSFYKNIRFRRQIVLYCDHVDWPFSVLLL